ncbi:division/cell wall cluster transcriptional repressor MraZ [Pontixanthobacter gangjinensis]
MAGALPIRYSGQALTFMGDKGRFVLPPDFRNMVKESSEGRVLCLASHSRFGCLVGFGLSRQLELDAQLDREEEMASRVGREFDREIRENQLFGFKRIPFDDSGRFTMPDFLQSQGQVGDALYFQGAGPSFTVWNPAILAQQNDDWNGAKAACADLLTEAEAKRK